MQGRGAEVVGNKRNDGSNLVSNKWRAVYCRDSDREGKIIFVKVSRVTATLAWTLAMLAALACNGTDTTVPHSGTFVAEQALPSVLHITTGSGSGTGFIINESGLVVTNRHVVEGARRVSVILSTGEEFRGDVIQRHSVLDLAYIQINSDQSFTPLALGDSNDVRIGEAVIAIGYPLGEELGLEPTVSRGIISAKRDEYLQTDASLNPGNSGGPLLSGDGRVIGVITFRVERTETGQPISGIGFAISINELKQMLAVAGMPVQTLVPSMPTSLPTIQPTPDIQATKSTLDRIDAHRRASEQATRIATEGQQEAERYAASLDATRVAEAPTPTAVPSPDIEATKSAIEAIDASRRESDLATRTAAEAHQEAERFAASLEATRIAELPTPIPQPTATYVSTHHVTPIPTSTPGVPGAVAPPNSPAANSSVGAYFTRGSTQDDLLHIQGTPTDINTYSALGKEVWNYGFSTVTFSLPDGLVSEWSDTGNLRVELVPRTGAPTNPDYFTRGSTQDDLLHIQGTPTDINTYSALGKEVWNYGFSTVTFSLPDGLVSEWSDIGNLRVELVPRTGAPTNPDYFTRGSTQDDLLHIQGTPTDINTYSALGKEVWNYGFSTVTFSLPDGLVSEWSDTGNLEAR